MSKICNVYAREILDSRGNPTVEVEVLLSISQRKSKVAYFGNYAAQI